MPRRMSPEQEREYLELLYYLGYYCTRIWDVDRNSPDHPANVAENIAATHGRSKALQGLRQAVNDTIENLADQPLDFIQGLDSELRKRNIITFSEIRRRYASAYRRILKRGRIKTETEYHIIAGILADSTITLDDQERAMLAELITRHERDL